MLELWKDDANLTTGDLDVEDLDAGLGGATLQTALHVVDVTGLGLGDVGQHCEHLCVRHLCWLVVVLVFGRHRQTQMLFKRVCVEQKKSVKKHKKKQKSNHTDFGFFGLKKKTDTKKWRVV